MVVSMDPHGALSPSRRPSRHHAVLLGLAAAAAGVIAAVLVYGLVVLAMYIAITVFLNDLGSNK